MNQSAFHFGPARKVWSVSALLAELKGVLDREFFDVWVEGEVSNFHQSAARHCYFSLKDGAAQVRAAMFAGQARYLRCKLADGMQVLARGRLSLYEARGELQLYVEQVEPLGLGSLQLAFEQLKEKLAAEGLFEAARKRPLPRLPRRVGLITSPQGAAVADMIRILRRRYPNISILLFPVQVQGDAAAAELRAAVEYFAAPLPPAQRVDVLIVGRGGGSFEDLWAFNDEALARAIARSPVPVISAVGHETDFCIADFVADLRAPTPSAAAELVVRPKADLLADCSTGARHLRQAMRYQLLQRRRRLDDQARHGAFQTLRHRLAQRAQRLDELAFRLRSAQRARLERRGRRLAVAEARLRQRDAGALIRAMRGRMQQSQARALAVWQAAMAARRHRLERLESLLGERNPLALLERGYALVYDARGHLALSPDNFAAGDEVKIRLAAGWLEAEARAARKQ